MAISFADSLKIIRENEESSISVIDSFDNFAVVYDVRDAWTQDTRYPIYSEYYDNAFSIVDQMKNVKMDDSQINISQEANSQFIPFEMDRFYDGFDLVNTTLSFFFLDAAGVSGTDSPINVTYNSEKIRFGWLIDSRVTSTVGRVQFEIHATGVNSKNEKYVWKSRPNDVLTVLPSISD